MDGYEVGQKPPGLAEDGSFLTALGARAYSIISDDGVILLVSKDTNLLTEEDAEDE